MTDDTEDQIVVEDEEPKEDEDIVIVDDEPEELAAKKKEYTPEEEEEYSKKVKKKIGKMTWELREAQRQLEEKEKLLQERDERLAELQSTHKKSSMELLDDQEKELNDRLQTAGKDGDFTTVTQISTELRKLDRKRFELELEGVKRQPTEKPKDEKKGKEGEEKLAPAARDWIDDNADWFLPDGEDYDERKSKRAKRLARTIKERYGYDDDDPELYERIDRQLNPDDDDESDDVVTSKFKGGRNKVAGDSGRGKTKLKTNKKQLTNRDLKNMVKYKFGNPDDPADRAKYYKYTRGVK